MVGPSRPQEMTQASNCPPYLQMLESQKRGNHPAIGSSVDISKDAQITELRHQLEQLEVQAQAELEELHEEMLEMRQTCQKMEVALNESEAKR